MKDRPLVTHDIHKRQIYATGRIRTCIARNQAVAELRLRPRGHGIGDCGVTSLKMADLVGMCDSAMNVAVQQSKAT
jgi:hypothetical protein